MTSILAVAGADVASAPLRAWRIRHRGIALEAAFRLVEKTLPSHRTDCGTALCFCCESPQYGVNAVCRNYFGSMPPTRP
jgi:hypothetical protein